MTREDVLAEIRETRPNEYADDWLIRLVDELEQRILTELMAGYIVPAREAQVTPDGIRRALVANAPYSRIYYYWLLVHIDQANGEYDRYNNDLQLFNAAWDEYAKHISRTFRRERESVYRVW